MDGNTFRIIIALLEQFEAVSTFNMATPCSHCREHSSYCSTCVANALQAAHERRHAALEEWRDAKEACTIHFQTAPEQTSSKLLELKARSDQLRDTLDERRQLCSDYSIRICKLQVANEERHDAVPPPSDDFARKIHTLEEWIVDGLSDQLEDTRRQVYTLRWQWALTVFSVYPIQVEGNEAETTTSGIGKICGLPLPNVGSELLGFLPPSELQSALRLTALVTQTVARSLAIPLPHPIRLSSKTISSDIANEAAVSQPDASVVTKRIELSSMATLQESTKSNTSIYRLADSKTEEFQVAWQFLQNDILALCIRAGVSVDKLSSGEAVLCNLRALQRHCYEQVTL